MRLGIDSTRFLVTFGSIASHTSLILVRRSLLFEICCLRTSLSTWSHKCSMGLRSGLWAGHSNSFTLFLLKNSVVDLDLCLGSLSCWNVYLRPNPSLLADCF